MKISILGAGPAGSTAAYYLARSGAEVELIDNKEFPRDKPCAGGLFNPLLFHREFPHIERLRGLQLHRVRITCGKHSFEHISRNPLLKTVLRREFDHFLLNEAIEAGATFYVNRNPDGEVLIQATGARFIRDYREAGICMVNNFESAGSTDTIHIHIGFGGIKGYAWLFPKIGYINVGVGAYLPQPDIRSIYRRYLDCLRDEGLLNNFDNSCRAKIIPFAPVSRPYTDRGLIVGDAAGFVKPGNGEGIYFAMLSGKIAAQAVIENHSHEWYKRRCMERFGRYLKPVPFNWNRSLLNRVMERAIRSGGRDTVFAAMIVENFFRLRDHRFGPRFLMNILK
jgi:flavin-dependent dehydrogenase